MLLKNIYKLLRDYVNNDGTDNYFGIDTFNNSIRDEVRSLIIDVIEEESDNTPDQAPMTDYLLDSDANAGATAGVNLPSDYLRPNNVVWVPTSGSPVPVELISIGEYNNRLDNLTKPPLATNYVAYIQGTKIYYRPSLTAGNFYLYYVKDPVVDTVGSESPFLDYYSDANSEQQFLAVGATVGSGSGLTGTYRDGRNIATMPNGTAATGELPIPEEFHLRLFERFIDRLGLKDKDQLSIQYAAMKEQEEQQKN